MSEGGNFIRPDYGQAGSDQEYVSQLQYEIVKSQCKDNNDYKSLAAVARVQRKAAGVQLGSYKSTADIFFK